MEKLYIDLSVPLYGDFTGSYLDGVTIGNGGGETHEGHYVCADGSHYATADGRYYSVT